MLKVGDRVKIYSDKLPYYKRYAYSFMNLNASGVVCQVMEETVVVKYDSVGFNINKEDLYVVG